MLQCTHQRLPVIPLRGRMIQGEENSKDMEASKLIIFTSHDYYLDTIDCVNVQWTFHIQ